MVVSLQGGSEMRVFNIGDIVAAIEDAGFDDVGLEFFGEE